MLPNVANGSPTVQDRVYRNRYFEALFRGKNILGPRKTDYVIKEGRLYTGALHAI